MALCCIRNTEISWISRACRISFADCLGRRRVGSSASSLKFIRMADETAAQNSRKVQIYPDKSPEISHFWREKYEKDARKYWDIFYKRNENRFFKDRHYLDKEWGQYFIAMDIDAGPSFVDTGSDPSEQRRTVLEVGCGTGNTVFPLIAQYPDLFVYACDFSPRAVDLVKVVNSLRTFPHFLMWSPHFDKIIQAPISLAASDTKDSSKGSRTPRFIFLSFSLPWRITNTWSPYQAHEEYSENRVKAFICDIASDPLVETIPPASVDVVTLVFMLSALGPEKMPTVVRKLKSVLKPGGHILFRDYAVGDLAQERFMTKDQKISENFYVRGDGTRAYYFSEDGLKKLFGDEGFECKEMVVHNRQLENRARKIKMDRRWIQCVFYLPDAWSEFSGIQEEVVGVSFLQDSHEVSKLIDVAPFKENVSAYSFRDGGTGKSIDEHRQTPSEIGVSWEAEEEVIVDLSEGFVAELFGGAPSPELLEVVVGEYKVHAMCFPNENQHTFAATGFMLWDSALALASLLAMNPHLTQGRSVLELGCGSVGLCSLIACMAAEKVVATDGDSGTLDLLRDNLQLNKERFGVQKITRHKLEWGNKEEISTVSAANGNKGFDLIIGSDVTYVKDAVPLLFETARSLLLESRVGMPEPQLLLCHRIRRVAESDILACAAAHGFCIKGLWTSDGIVPDEVARNHRLRIEVLLKGLEDVATKHNALQLVLFTPSR